MRPPPLVAALTAILAWLWRWLPSPPLPCGWSAEFIASPAFLRTREWTQARYQALKANDGRCECCGRSQHDGVRLDVDHIIPRHRRPDLALSQRNLQILCGDRLDGTPGDGCNRGKGGWDDTGWRRRATRQ